ncbi:MAG: hypothetical protein H5T80_09820 [Dietzia sp.]|nr:hypothetical protein [Dietzia sp.]
MAGLQRCGQGYVVAEPQKKLPPPKQPTPPPTRPQPGRPAPTSAAPEPELAAEPDHGPEPAISDPGDAHQAQILADMRAEPIRMCSDAQLDQLIATLRRTATRQDATALPGQSRQSRVEQVRTAHARLTEQAEAIGAALLARADDRAALAAELQQAQQADDRDEEIRRRNTERAARAADDLQKALAERDRRSALPPIDAAIEHQLRATHAPTQRQTGPTLEEQAAHLQAEQDHGSDHGPEL